MYLIDVNTLSSFRLFSNKMAKVRECLYFLFVLLTWRKQVFAASLNETYFNRTTSISPGQRIVGGQVVTHRSDFAFQVSLRNNGWPSCGASVIDNRHLLTAAHCVTDDRGRLQNLNRFAAVLGDLRTDISQPTRVVRRITHIFVHERYNPDTIDNDVAVLRVDSLIFNVNINSIPMATFLPLPNTNCTVSGWGLIHDEGPPSPLLLFAHVKLHSQQVCQSIYGILFRAGMICAGYNERDSCNGDSGGPLVCNGVQVGIVSWGVEGGCADPNFPGVYASVPHYQSWIRTQQQRSTSSSMLAHEYMALMIVFIYFIYVHGSCK